MDPVSEVDLHLRAFMRNTTGLSAGDMLDLSINRMKTALEQAIIKGQRQIRFIHGQGKGTLKQRVYDELEKYAQKGKIVSFESSFFNPDIVIVTIGY